jgi:hypothetical protein
MLGFLIDFTVTGKKLLAELPLDELLLDPRLSSGVLVEVFEAVGLGGSDSGTTDTLGAIASGATDSAFEIA